MFDQQKKNLIDRITKGFNQDKQLKTLSFENGLRVLSKIYGVAVSIRIWLYRKQFLKQKSLPCMVISIGNISVGGTGKTPMAIYIAAMIKSLGKKPVVVSRGYKGKYSGDTMIVSDGERIFADAQTAGDEPYMMALRRLFPVIVGKDRYLSGCKAIDMFNPDVILLDDGFQHLRLKRDIDFVLLDSEKPFGNTIMLPAGPLREPVDQINKRGDVLIFTRFDEDTVNMNQMKITSLKRPALMKFTSFYKPFIYFQKEKSGAFAYSSMKDLKGKTAVMFSGLARNDTFYKTMTQCSVNVLAHLEFPDHYWYKASDIFIINQSAQKKKADMILTTEKDWVKFDPHTEWDTHFIVIGIDIQFHDPDSLKAYLRSAF